MAVSFHKWLNRSALLPDDCQIVMLRAQSNPLRQHGRLAAIA
jgi:hypothetical protein